MMSLETRTIRTFMAFVLVLVIGDAACLAEGAARDRPPDRLVPYCELIKHVSKFDHQVVETEVIYTRGIEISSAYDVSCRKSDQLAWVDEFTELRKATPAALMERVETWLRKDRRVRVKAVVEFDGPKGVDIPPGTPPETEALMRGMNSRYGHMNRFGFRIMLIKLIAAEPVPASVPWPRRS